MSSEVAPDGSPVDVYLALPADETPDLIDAAIARRSSILELGSGPGRITRPLVDKGHTVVAVDESPQMLAHVAGAETVQADIFTLSLRRTFDVVVAGNHLINGPDANQRTALLTVCRRHVRSGGAVLVERYDPDWALDPQAGQAQLGPVHVDFEPIAVAAESFRGRVTYTLQGQSWIQEFSASCVTDDMLRSEAAAVGLRLAGWLNEPRTWARLTVGSES